jgi:hypothetical protein
MQLSVLEYGETRLAAYTAGLLTRATNKKFNWKCEQAIPGLKK